MGCWAGVLPPVSRSRTEEAGRRRPGPLLRCRPSSSVQSPLRTREEEEEEEGEEGEEGREEEEEESREVCTSSIPSVIMLCVYLCFGSIGVCWHRSYC